MKERNINIGDRVLKQQEQNKFTPKFEPRSYRVVDKSDTMVTAESENTGKRITRNILFSKEIPETTQITYAKQEEDTDDRDI